MISLDYSVIYQIILFVVLGLILNKVLFRPYLALLEEREGKTSGARQETADLEREGQRLKAQYEGKIAQAQAAGNAAKEAILQEARQQRETLINRAREETANSLEQARHEVQSALQTEMQLAVAEAKVVAREMVRKVLGRNVA